MAGQKFSDKNDYESYAFSAAVILVMIIALFVAIIKRIFHAYPCTKKGNIQNCSCKECQFRDLREKYRKKKKNINWAFFIYIILLVVLSFVFVNLCIKISNEHIKVFDPYEILEIESSASPRQIKKAYNRLVKKYHPDKSQEKYSQQKFIDVSLAYKALTDERAKRNYLKYGHPDGPGFLRFGLAIPKFLMEGKVGNGILIGFIIIIVLILPIGFMKWFNNSKNFNEVGMYSINQSVFYYFIDYDVKITELPFIVGLAAEFENFTKEKNQKEFEQIVNELKRYEKYFPPVCNETININKLKFGNFKAMLFLYYHYLGQHNLIRDHFTYKEIIYIYQKSELIISCLLDMVLEFNDAYKNYQVLRKSENFHLMLKNEELNLKFLKDHIKPYSYDTLLTTINFSQGLYQHLDFTKDKYSLLQLPLMTASSIVTLKEVNSIMELQNNPSILNKSSINNIELANVKNALNYIPLIKINNLHTEVFEVDEHKTIISIEANINRETCNEIKGESKILGINHSRIFPYKFDEKYLVILKNNMTHEVVNVKGFKCSTSFMSYNYKYELNCTFSSPARLSLEVYSLNYTGLYNQESFEVQFDDQKQFKVHFEPFQLLSDDYFKEMYLQPIPCFRYDADKKNI